MLEKIGRYREIITIFLKYGLGGWVSRLNVDFLSDLYDSQMEETLTEFSSEQRVRMALTDLGPTFIKLGQILSTRADLVGLDLAEELQLLQSDIPPDPKESVRLLIEEEFECKLEKVFPQFDFNPIGSASIGQVHEAKLRSGEKVVVKVQHVDIEEKIQLDLEILIDLANLIESNISESRYYRPVQTCEEFKRTLLKELDFSWEGKNLKKFAENFSQESHVHVPEVFEEYTTQKILTMEKIEGVLLSQLDELKEKDYDLSRLAREGAQAFLKMIFEDGLYHADPHPGNIIVKENQHIALIDCGMTGYLDDELREDLEDLLMYVVQRDSKRIIQILARISLMPPNLERTLLQRDVINFVEFYTSVSVKDLDINKALSEVTNIIRRHKIILPSSISLLLKVIVVLEGTSSSLDPNFNLIDLMKPYQSRAIWKRFSPKRQQRIWINFYKDMEKFLTHVPLGITEIVSDLKASKFVIKVESKQFEYAINRLVFGLITAAFFLGSVDLMSSKTPPLLWDFSLPGTIGYIVSLGFGIKLLWAIYISGNLNKDIHEK